MSMALLADLGAPATTAAAESSMSSLPALERVLEAAALVVGVLAAAILLLGVARSAWWFVRSELRARPDAEEDRDELRRTLGQYLLLGLELLVAADVLETIRTPSLDHVLVLAGVVIIRTVIGFSLNWELSRHGAGRDATAASAASRSS